MATDRDQHLLEQFEETALMGMAEVLRDLVAKSADVYGFTVEPIVNGTLVSVPDGKDRDWFVLRDCGHVSTLFSERGRAMDSTCPICEEARISDANARHVLNRLSHVRSLSKVAQSF